MHLNKVSNVCIHLKFYSNDRIFWVHVVHVNTTL